MKDENCNANKTREFMEPRLNQLVNDFQNYAHVDPDGMGLDPVPLEDVNAARGATVGAVIMVAWQMLLDNYPPATAMSIVALLSQDMRDVFTDYLAKRRGVTTAAIEDVVAKMEGEGLPPMKES